jgi:ribosomal-protein-alanine N-acetyltransferase
MLREKALVGSIPISHLLILIFAIHTRRLKANVMMTIENKNTKIPAGQIHTRFINTRQDVRDLAEIENLCFPVPWTEADFNKTLNHRNCIGIMAEQCDIVSGYAIYFLSKRSIILANMAVLPRLQGKGIGRAMIEKLKAKLDRNRRVRISADIRESNLDAQLFFKAMGFKAKMILRDYYDKNTTVEDAYRFEFWVK